MSLYKRSWLFIAWVMVLFLTFPIWMIALEQQFGNAGGIAGGIFWLSQGLIAMFVFRCPDCGRSLFLSKKGFLYWSHPWPRKICGQCGRDHTSTAEGASA